MNRMSRNHLSIMFMLTGKMSRSHLPKFKQIRLGLRPDNGLVQKVITNTFHRPI